MMLPRQPAPKAPAPSEHARNQAAELLRSHSADLLRKAAAIQGTPIDVQATLLQSSVSPSFAQRARDAFRYLVAGVGPENWFGPWQPLPPFADKPEQGTRGRRFDYPAGVNLNISPRSQEAVSFGTLRALADAYDLLRVAIETRKDQIAKYAWKIVPSEKGVQEDEVQAEVAKAMKILERPDRDLDWDDWLRALCEDNLVLDAVAIYPRKTRGGDHYSFDLIDAATIKRVVDVEGRTPAPPSPAYQQILKGVPAVDYTSDELVYWARNVRTNKLYGYGPVERIIVTVNMAIRRQQYQLEYFTEGNIPDAIMSVPESWTPDQIKEFQDYWDSLLEGVTGRRRKVKFGPEMKTVLSPKDTQLVLSDAFDEWLARIICWAFGLSPVALLKQVNRASSEQIDETAKEEGLSPLLDWLERKINALLKRAGVERVKFVFDREEEIDPKVAAEIDRDDVKAGIQTIDEVRGARGKTPLGLDKPLVYTSTGYVPIAESLDRQKEDFKNPPPPPPGLGPTSGADKGEPTRAGAAGEAVPPKGGKPGEKPEDKVEKVVIHQGDVNVRVPAPELPDVHVHVHVPAEERKAA